jgi:FimV-like protein
MPRKILVVFFMLLLSLTTKSFGLVVGGITVESALNQRLLARIELLEIRDTELADIVVQLASADDFQRLGIDRLDFLRNIEFSIESDGQGVYVLLTTNQAVRETYLSFVVETRWPSGRLVSAYTTLLDLPVFNDQITTRTRQPISPVLRAPTQVVPTQPFVDTVTPDSVTTPLVSVPVIPSSAEPVIETPGNGPAVPPTQDESVGAGVIEAAEETAAITAAAASQDQGLLATGVEPLAPPASGPDSQDAEPQGQLSVVTTDPIDDAGASATVQTAEGSAELDTRIAELENQLAVRQEEADRAQIEREELDGRLQDLELQIAAAKEIVRLQDIQLAQLQESLAQVAADAELAAEQEETVPVSEQSVANDLLRILGSDSLFIWFALALVILLLAVLLLKRNRAAKLDDADMDDFAEQEFDALAEEGDTSEASAQNEVMEGAIDELQDVASRDLESELEDMSELGESLEGIDSEDNGEDQAQVSTPLATLPITEDDLVFEPEEMEVMFDLGSDGDGAEESLDPESEETDDLEFDVDMEEPVTQAEVDEPEEEFNIETLAFDVLDPEGNTVEAIVEEKAKTESDDAPEGEENTDEFDELEFLSEDGDEEIRVENFEEVELLLEDDVATKLELAYAYQKMGDAEGANEILLEVIAEGNDEQVKEAKALVETSNKSSD